MKAWVISVVFLGQLFAATQQELTPNPSGPFHVDRNRIIDSKGRPFLMRGTQLTEFHPQTAAADNRGGLDFGPHSATSLSAIRLRFNMNTVRLPLDVKESGRLGYLAALAKVVQRANSFDLLVILAAREPSVGFWSQCAAYFKAYPNVMFDVWADADSSAGWYGWRSHMTELVQAVRSAGAAQPIVAMSRNGFESAGVTPPLDDPNVIYELAPRYPAGDRQAQYGSLAAVAPVTAAGWDLELNDKDVCSTLPSDPSPVTSVIRANLEDFDARRMSWTVSLYAAGRLIKDYSLQDATSLEDGWTCGQVKYPPPGMGRIVEGHLRAVDERGLFVVSAAGGVDVARNGFAIGYGPVLAERDSIAPWPRLSLNLGKLALLVTDSKGVARPARMFWASAGWGQINFVVPPESALGPARLAIVREDGSRTNAQITIADTSPGFWTGVSCRGPAEGEVIQTFADGRTARSPLSSCRVYGDCRTELVPVANGAVTRVRLHGSGFRYAESAAKIEVTVGGRRVPVVAYGAFGSPGVDVVTIELPASLRGIGETDLMCHLNGRVSNAVRIRIGS